MKRYENMTREERIEHSDKVAIAALQEELTKRLKRISKTTTEKVTTNVSEWISSKALETVASNAIGEWLKSKAVKDWLKEKYGR